MSVNPRVRDVLRHSVPKPRERKPKRRYTGAHPTTIIIVKDRARGCCERCARSVPTEAEVHHRIPRGMGGSRDPRINQASNLVVLCGDCHRWIESYRNAARDRGWLLHRSDNPWEEPIFSHLHGYVLLGDDGSVTPVGAP
jgi:5-methylcytosine-specific restriction protein A